jgi:glycogen debranching enzyme
MSGNGPCSPFAEKGLANQGWKESGDGVPFPDGSLPEPPIALVEVQGYVHDAKLRMS